MDKVAQRERCHAHPSAPARARCDVCGRPVCADCAVPVRGEVVGRECLATVLPDPPPPPAAAPARPRRAALDVVAIGSLVVATAASALPWSRFGVGSGPFGAWGFFPSRWSSLVGPVAIAGLVALVVASRPRNPASPAWRAAIALGAGGAVLVLSLLFVIRPPAFTGVNGAPWLTATAGAVVAGCGIALLRGLRRAAAPIA